MRVALIGIALAGAVHAQVGDPLPGPAWIAEGDLPGAFFGGIVRTAGDVNGDGFSDLVVGAEGFDGGSVDEGAVSVFYGSASGLALVADWTAQGDLANGLFGSGVAAAGDVNGDGFHDVIVGAPGHGNGRIFVYFGGPAGLGANGTPANADWTWEDDQLGSGLGAGEAVASCGDVNGDGFDDIVVGAPLYDAGGVDTGRAYVFLGSASGPVDPPHWTGSGFATTASSGFGQSVNTAGDLDADGFSDVVIGAPGAAGNGAVFVWHGSAGGLAPGFDWTAGGTSAGEQFGFSASTAGDFDGDGYSDLVVGSPQRSLGELEEGAVYFFRGSALGLQAGSSSDVFWGRAESDQAGARLGHSVATAGDFNGDGYADVVAGIPFWDVNAPNPGAGRLVLFAGKRGGIGTVVTGSGFRSFPGDQADAHLGSSVGAGGDVNGDGFSDLVAGEPDYDNPDNGEGRAVLLSGSSLGTSSTASWTADGDNVGVGSWFGRSVAGAGDVDGDGFGDLLIGEPNHSTASLFLGSATGLPANSAAVWEAQPALDIGFGDAVAGAGDVNGDGLCDVLVGAKFNGPDGAAGSGRAYLYHGSDSGVPLAPSPSWTSDGVLQPEAWYGSALAGAGDVNGDGFGDVIIGSHGHDTLDHLDAGRAYLFLGSKTGLHPGDHPAWTAEGDQVADYFGISVASAGDVNGDGFSDVIIGAPSFDGPGRAFVYHGSPSGLQAGGPADWTGVGSGQSQFGFSVSGAGDVDGDGFDDVLVGAPTFGAGSGQAYLFRGSATGLELTPAWTADIVEPSPGFAGYSVAAAGDLNGDGFADVLIGAPFDDFQTGKAYLFLGSAGGLMTLPSWTSVGDGGFGDSFGYSVAGAGDVNGDGIDEVVVGAIGHNASAGRAYVYIGNGGGPPFAPQQRRADNLAPIQLLGRSESTTDFRVRIASSNPSGFASTPLGREDVFLEWEIEERSAPFDGLGLVTTPALDTGPTESVLVFDQPISALTPLRTYKWRARLGTHNPLYPHGRWLSIPAAGDTQARLRTGSDCNQNGVDDPQDIVGATSPDCDLNGIPDECDVAANSTPDCNANGVPDRCDIAFATSPDCNLNGTPDECDLLDATSPDCNGNSIPDECDILSGASLNCNGNEFPDECEPDGDGNGVPDECQGGVGTLSCFGVGCPCGNDDATAGCATSTGSGALLLGSVSASVASDDLVLLATGLPPLNNGLFYMGDTPTQNFFFDGFQCALGSTWRFLCCIQNSGEGGTMTLGPGIAADASVFDLIVPGSTWGFHAWFRDGGTPCGSGANLTNLVTVTFTP